MNEAYLYQDASFNFRSFIALFIVFIIFWLAYDTAKEPERLISLLGLCIYILIGFLFSKNRDQVSSTTAPILQASCSPNPTYTPNY